MVFTGIFKLGAFFDKTQADKQKQKKPEQKYEKKLQVGENNLHFPIFSLLSHQNSFEEHLKWRPGLWTLPYQQIAPAHLSITA